jgi:hypothetical protein
MEWNGGKGFELSPGNWAPREEWVFQGESAGMYQTARNLTYVLFYNSSHMVPFDVPLRSRDMLERFIGVNIDSIIKGIYIGFGLTLPGLIFGGKTFISRLHTPSLDHTYPKKFYLLLFQNHGCLIYSY